MTLCMEVQGPKILYLLNLLRLNFTTGGWILVPEVPWDLVPEHQEDFYNIPLRNNVSWESGFKILFYFCFGQQKEILQTQNFTETRA